MDFTQARLNMIESQVRPNGVTNSRVIEAMTRVSREDFVPPSKRNVAYLDGNVRINSHEGNARYLLEPMTFARMLQSAAIKSTDRVLMVGAAPGYGAAVVAHLAKEVIALDVDLTMFDAAQRNLGHVKLVQGPLAQGHADSAPYDVIIVEGRISEVPQALSHQLAEGGRLVTGLGEGPNCSVTLMTRTEGSMSNRATFDAAMPVLPGFDARKAAFVF